MLQRLFHVVLVTTALLSQGAVHAALPDGLALVRSVEGVDEYRLANGMQLLLVADDSKPTTSVNLVYRVGSRHESYGETGMAHLLEHLLFKGTPTHPAVWNEFTRRGLVANGSTAFDRTNYTASFAANKDNLDWYLGWLADAMTNSFIARKDLDTEMTVVRNEMERGENSPGRILFAKTLAAMYDWHNYGHSTIGARADVENVDVPSLQAFYRKYYQPDNATLVIAGRFDRAALLDVIARSFGRIAKPTRPLVEPYTIDPVQEGERSVVLRRSGGVPMIYAGYHVMPAADPDYAAIELLQIIMGDSPSGRLHKQLVEPGLAAEAFAFSQALADPGYVMFGTQLGTAQDVERARGALLQTVESVARQPIAADELARARRKWLKDWLQVYSNPEAVGSALGEAVAQGDWRLFFLIRDRIEALDLARVQRVAEQTLLAANRTVGTYLPTDAAVRPPAPRRVDVAEQLKNFEPRKSVATVEAFEATPENIDARTRRFKVGGLEAAVLPKATRGDVVNAVLTLRFGDAQRLFGSGDVPDFLAAMLDKGTATLSRQQVQDRLDELQADVGFSTGAGRLTVRVQTRRATLIPALELVAQMLKNPALPADVLEEIKRQALAGIDAQRKQPGAVASEALARWGDTYPRGDVRHARSFDERIADVNAVTIERVRAFHQSFYGAGHAQFGAVGDMDVAAVQQSLEAAFAGWQTGARFERVATPYRAVPPTRLVIETPEKPNATMLVRQPLALNDDSADYPALSLANYLLGGGGSSRIWKRIREAEGLSYDAGAHVSWGQIDEHSEWRGNAIFAPQVRSKVEAAFKEEVARAREKGFTAEELANGKRGLLNFRRLGRAQDASVAAGLANNLYVGRTFQKSAEVDAALQALTLDQVNAALRRHLDPAKFVYAIAGDFKP